MTKKMINQKGKFDEQLINTIEPNFVFEDKPINRFNIVENSNDYDQTNKVELLEELKKQINSIENCNLKDNSKNLVLGNGNINSPIMLIGEAPGAEEDKSSIIFQGEVGELLNKMLIAIGSPAVILYGDDEIKSGKATLKNLETGNESSVKIEDLVNEIKKIIWTDYKNF